MKLILLCLSFALSCCSPNRIITVWKKVPAHKTEFNRIMVVAILQEEDSALRKKIETEATTSLRNLGYPAVSALDHFGAKGLAGMEQEVTYIKLCNNGIDLVLTIALIQKTKEKYYDGKSSMLYPASYYYNRIWNYKNKLADETNSSPEYFYESILFDLGSLQALSVFNTHLFAESEKMKNSQDLATRLVRKMTKEKVLTKQITRSLKPF